MDTRHRHRLPNSMVSVYARTCSQCSLGLSFCLFVFPLLLMVGNPAIALLAGAAIALIYNRPVIRHAGALSRYCLQTAIVLLGFRLNLETVCQLSTNYTLGITLFVLGVLGLGLLFGFLLRTQFRTSQLITAGTAICGGTTIATLSPIINAKAHETSVTLGLVFLLNLVALLLFPVIGNYLELSDLEFGLWSALAIHDTSSVVATAFLYSDAAAEIATTVKIVRSLWLIPLSFGVSILAGKKGARLQVPGFIVMFIAAVVIGSVVTPPEMVIGLSSLMSRSLMVCALFLIGTESTRSIVLQIRGKVFYQAILLWITIVPVTLIIIRFLV